MKKRITVKHIEDLICVNFDCTDQELKGKSRKTRVVIPRHFFAYLLWVELRMGVEEMGAIMNKHHSTAINSLSVAQDLLDTDKNLREQIAFIRWRIDQIRNNSVLEYYPVAS